MNFLSIADLTAKELKQVLILAKKRKNRSSNLLKGKTMVLLFEKPSLRTKLSFDVAMNQLGGHSVYFNPQEFGLGTREPASDIGKVVSSMADLIVARVFSHSSLTELAAASSVSVINALSDLEHPCQALADFLTILEVKGKLEGLTLAYVGDGDNNVTHSLALGCSLFGMNFRCASPKGFWMNKEIVQKAKRIVETDDPAEAVKNADIVYTDTWVSMGAESEKTKRLKIFKPYQVNKGLMQYAKKDAIFMHDMPAYRG
ncbi:ornithine carbamoyltransferase, partial [Candidatus Daviesbacteria bacterium]|nr:ornithine carbamoyltransferase [Candidatus Daviesbacteria bacterium]